MPKFRIKVVVEAEQWNGHDDPSSLKLKRYCACSNPESHCRNCSYPLKCHGYLPTPTGWRIICPCDWIITDSKGRQYPCKPDLFEIMYQPIDKTSSQFEEPHHVYV